MMQYKAGEYGLALYGSEQGPMEGSCEHTKQTFKFHTRRGFTKKYSAVEHVYFLFIHAFKTNYITFILSIITCFTLYGYVLVDSVILSIFKASI
jgi:hypothetical protein